MELENSSYISEKDHCLEYARGHVDEFGVRTLVHLVQTDMVADQAA